ncbi:MAG: MOSC domain-containing protein [Microbacterium sp.]
MRVARLYRYPVKGFTPVPCDEIVVQDDGRVQGDRVLAFRFADAAAPEERDGFDYWPKSKGLALMDFPSLGRLQLSFDGETLRIAEGDEVIVEAGLDEAGRRQISDRVGSWMIAGPEVRRLNRPGRLPLKLVGDGVTSRFQDRPRGFITLHGEATVDDVGSKVSAPVDDRRFRSNIVIEGSNPWEELQWASDGATLEIGGVRLVAQAPIGRCMAVAANPDTGIRDVNLMQTLTTEFDQQAPTLGILTLPDGAGGTIRVGDELTVAMS